MSDFEPSLSLQDVLNYVAENRLGELPLPDIHGHPYDTSITPVNSEDLPEYGEGIIDARWLHFDFRQTASRLANTSLRATLHLSAPLAAHAINAVATTNVTDPNVRGSHYSKALGHTPLLTASTLEKYTWLRNTASVLGIRRIIADLEASKEYPEYSYVSRVYALERPLDRRITTLQPGQAGTVEGIIQEHHRPPGTYIEKSAPPTLEVAPRGQRDDVPRERITLSLKLPPATSSHQTLFKPLDLEALEQGDLVQLRVYEHEGELSTALRPDLIMQDVRNGLVPSVHLVSPAQSDHGQRWEASLARATDFHNHLDAIRTAADGPQFREAVGSFLLSRINMEEGNLRMTPEEFEAFFINAHTADTHSDDPPIGLSIRLDTPRVSDALAIKNTYNKNFFAMNKEELAELARNVISGSVQPNPNTGPHTAYLGLLIKQETPEAAADIYEKTLSVMLPRLLGPEKLSSHDRSFVGHALQFAYMHPDHRLMTDMLVRASYSLFNPAVATPDQYVWSPALRGIQNSITHCIKSKDGYIRHNLTNFTDDNLESVVRPEVIDVLAPLLMPLLDQADKMIEMEASAKELDNELGFMGATIRKMHTQTAEIRRTFALVLRKRLENAE